ncbi:integrase [Yersinia kristensenii]|nr:integrase [Yersinia kristensenii]CNH37726.1 integrase [Yersinia kristensenii]CNK39026.1 integrase [Yersinia kristensenii]CNL70736.1 integrase [Yersinia kristensenii]
MARQTKPLTDTEIKAVKAKDADYRLYDGDGLSLLIKSSGSKLWQFRYYRPFTKQRTKQTFIRLTQDASLHLKTPYTSISGAC